MLRSLVLYALFLSACQTSPKPETQEKATEAEVEKGPNVSDIVKPDQDKWLLGQVKDPGKAKITKLVIFGDSLSDPGNLHKISNGLLVPPRVFYKSRFSNGPLWADYTSIALGWKTENYAVGGAETGSNIKRDKITIPSLLEQINDNKNILKTSDFASTLLVIWIGPNNYFNRGIKAQDANQNPIAEILNEQVKDTIEDLQVAIDKLKGIGFRQFVIGTMPELGGINRSPKDPPKPSDATLFSATAAHNQSLRAMIKELQTSDPELNLSLFQAFEINQKTQDNPNNYGFNRLDAPCYKGNLLGQFEGGKRFCANPSAFKYWEYVHPNSKMHCYFASQFLADISAAGKIAGFDATKALARCQEL